MIQTDDDAKFRQLVQKMAPGSTLLRAWELKGGVSAQVTALEIAQPDGGTRKVVVRQHGPANRASNPQVAADEFRLLQRLHDAGLPVSTPVYLDQSGAIFVTPYIVVEYLEGAPDYAPAALPDFVRQCAAQMARIHAVNPATVDLSFLPQIEEAYTQKLSNPPATLDESLDEGRIRAALAAAWPLARRNTAGLLHGDFWPGNVLWQAGRLTAVLDWEDAQVGDPLADVGNTRLEFLWAFGREAMQQFTDDYQVLTALDFTDLPYWDLCAALRPAGQIAVWAGDPATEQQMREGHRWFITQAFARLAGHERP